MFCAGKALPAVFALLPGQTTDIYQKMWSKLKQHCDNYSPVCVTMDMEAAAAAGARKVFGEDLTVAFCWFHLRKAWREKLGSLSLLNETSYPVFNRLYRLCCAMAFVPPEDMGQVNSGIPNVSRCGLRS